MFDSQQNVSHYLSDQWVLQLIHNSFLLCDVTSQKDVYYRLPAVRQTNNSSGVHMCCISGVTLPAEAERRR